MLALTAGAMHWKPTDSIEAVFANLFLVHAWGVLDNLTFNTPSWTISAEWFAYLCFPLIAAFSRRLPWWCFIVPGIAAAYVEPSITTNSVAGGYWALKCLLLFISGFCWFRFGEHLGNSMLWRWGAILIGPFLIHAYWLPIPYFIWIFKVSLGLWILCLFKSGPVFFFANPVSVYLGKTSYLLYMTHSVAIVILTVKFGGVKPLWIEIPLLLAIASVVYHVIEEPGL